MGQVGSGVCVSWSVFLGLIHYTPVAPAPSLVLFSHHSSPTSPVPILIGLSSPLYPTLFVPPSDRCMFRACSVMLLCLPLLLACA